MEPLFPAYNTPKGGMPKITAIRWWTNPQQFVTSTIANPRPLSEIPAQVYAIMYWHTFPGEDPVRTTKDYGDELGYLFYLPDGSTRTIPTMSAQAYRNMVNRLDGRVDETSYPAG